MSLSVTEVASKGYVTQSSSSLPPFQRPQTSPSSPTRFATGTGTVSSPVQNTHSPYFGFWGGKYAERISSKGMDKAFGFITKTRTRELLIEDLMGFAILRTAWDSLRGVLYGSGELNGTAGRERFFREALSIFSDIFSSGIAALGIGYGLDKAFNGFSNKNINFQTLELIQDAMSPAQDGKPVSKYSDFLDNIATKLSNTKLHGGQGAKVMSDSIPGLQKKLATVLKANLATENFLSNWNTSSQSGLNQNQLAQIKGLFAGRQDSQLPLTAKQLEAQLTNFGINQPKKVAKNLISHIGKERALNIARTMGIEQLDVVLDKHHIKIPELMDDLQRLNDEMVGKTTDLAKNSWQPEAMLKRIKTTFRIKNIKLLGLVAGLTCTIASPLINHWITRTKDGVDYYPALDGLYAAEESKALNEAHQKKAEQKKNWLSRWLYKNGPHVTEQFDKGNLWPILGVVFPMSVPFWLDTVNRKVMKPSFKNFRNVLDFGKTFPFTTQQQIGSLFAFLIASRMFSSRNTDEYRERGIDSALGWGLWILGTPLIKNAAAKVSNLKGLVKESGLSGNKTVINSDEVKLIKGIKPNEADKLVKMGKSIGRSSLFLNILLLGVIEPFISIFYTQFASEKRANKKRLQIAQRLSSQANFQRHFNMQNQQTSNRFMYANQA